MEVILLERIEKLGIMGDVVKVKQGFARNYLLPQKKALRATKENVAQFAQHKSQLEASNVENRKEAEAIGARMEGLAVILVRQASDSDQLYGSVTTRDIAREVSDAGFTVSKTQIQLERPIKTVGMHPLRVRLHPEVSVTVTANVARTEEEAKIQASGKRVSAEGEDDDDLALEEAEALFEEGVEVDLNDAPAEDAPQEAAPDAAPEEAAGA